MGCSCSCRNYHTTANSVRGSRQSSSRAHLRRRRNMENNSTMHSDSDENITSSIGNSVAGIISYLIRSGQVRVYGDSDSTDYENDDGFDCVRPREHPKPDTNPDTSVIDKVDLKVQLTKRSRGSTYDVSGRQEPIPYSLLKREHGMLRSSTFTPADRCSLNSVFLPNTCEVKARFHNKVFCGSYSQDGNIFLSACQDRRIRVYNTSQEQFKLMKCIQALDVGWSVLDTAFSPDGNFLVYSSWSDYLHLCNIYGDAKIHQSLNLSPDTNHSFCIFSIVFSQDNREILGGSNDRCLYVYDREQNCRTLKIEAHEDDVNAVAFANDSSQILFSGSDDGLCKMWDRRVLKEQNPFPVGVFAGHLDGITFIDSMKDGQYLLSNSKDQSIKLWDVRKLSSDEAQQATRNEVARQNWDYRWQQVPKKVLKGRHSVTGDSSIMTYRGHCILNTLIRARFSPMFTTGQRYIYTGCATGAVIIYDILTGKIVKKLNEHQACVRDVSWHPYENKIMSTSWDATVREWSYRPSVDLDDSKADSAEGDDGKTRRRSARLAELRAHSWRARRFEELR